MNAAQFFLEQRPRLLALAYRLLGSQSDAEDMLQELWLRWRALTLVPDNAQAYLTRMLGNLCLDQLRTRRRQTYPGPWLPEPEDLTSAPEHIHDQWQSLSLAFLLVLEQLTPLQRVVWVLRELFDYRYAELGELVERSPAACRKLFERASQRLQQAPAEASSGDRQLAQQCLAACLLGDTRRLTELLAEDAELLSDGGGLVLAALRPIRGADKILRFFAGLRRKQPSGYTAQALQCNGMPALALLRQRELDGLLSCEVRDGRVQRLLLLRNPRKLRHLGARLCG